MNQCETCQFVLKPVHMKPLEFLAHHMFNFWTLIIRLHVPGCKNIFWFAMLNTLHFCDTYMQVAFDNVIWSPFDQCAHEDESLCQSWLFDLQVILHAVAVALWPSIDCKLAICLRIWSHSAQAFSFKRKRFCLFCIDVLFCERKLLMPLPWSP